jgi:hypothetical protein
MRSLTVFVQGVLTLGVVVMVLVSGLLIVAQGWSVEVTKAVGLLALFLGLLMVTERLTTGRWFRWSRS